MSQKIYKCNLCDYSTFRKFNYNRHSLNVHNNINIDNDINDDNSTLNGDDNSVIDDNNSVIIDDDKSTVSESFTSSSSKGPCICMKCNKFLSNKYKLNSHIIKCDGLDKLTCNICMKSFKSRQSKYNHMKKNNCIPRSTLYAQTPNIQNITNNSTINNTNSHNNNNNTTTINNNFTINNYNNERRDYLNFDVMFNCFKSANGEGILRLIEKTNFNNNFPENNNIKGNISNQYQCIIKKDNVWNYSKTSIAAENIIKRETANLMKFSVNNKNLINDELNNNELHTFLNENLLMLLYGKPAKTYKILKDKTKDLIINNSVNTKDYVDVYTLEDLK